MSRTTAPLYVGLDVGGTFMKAGVVDDAGKTLSSVSLPTEAQRGQDLGLERMCETIRAVVRPPGWRWTASRPSASPRPAPWTFPAGIILDPPNLKPWRNVPVRQHVQDTFSIADRVSKRRQRRGLRRILGRRRPGRPQHGAVHARHRRRRRHHHRRYGSPGHRGRAQPRRRAGPHQDRNDATRASAAAAGWAAWRPTPAPRPWSSAPRKRWPRRAVDPAWRGHAELTARDIFDAADRRRSAGRQDRRGHRLLSGRRQHEPDAHHRPRHGRLRRRHDRGGRGVPGAHPAPRAAAGLSRCPRERTQICYAELGNDAGFIGAAASAGSRPPERT